MAAAIPSNSNQFWDNVEKTKSCYEPDAPIIINGKKLTDNAENFRNEMFRACSLVDRFAREVFEDRKSVV